AIRAVARPVDQSSRATREPHHVALDRKIAAVGHLAAQFTLGPLGGDRLACRRDLDGGGNLDGRISDTRHGFCPFCPLPNAADEFPADALLPGRAVRHHSSRSADDHDAEAVADLRDVSNFRVAALPGTAHPLHPFDGRLSTMPLEVDTDRALPTVGLGFESEIRDIALFLEDLGDTPLR